MPRSFRLMLCPFGRRGFVTLLSGALVAAISLTAVCHAQSRSFRALNEMQALGLVSAWQTQLSTLGALDGRAHVNMYISPTQVRKIYDVVEDGSRTSFSGANAEHDADIRLRTILMSDRVATLEVREVPLITFFVQTGSGRLEAIDAETGERRWSVRIGGPDAPAYAPSGNDERLVAISGASLNVLSSATGKLISERSLGAMAETGPVVVGENAFVPASNGTFHVYSLTEESRHFPPKAMMSLGRALTQPRLTPAGVVWTTERGMVFVADPETSSTKFRIAARGRLIGLPAYHPANRLFSVMAEGYVLASDANDGEPIWEFAAGEPLASSAYVAGDTVYVGSVDRNLFAIDAIEGTQRWVTSGVSRIVAHSQGTLYGQSATHALVSVDAATGTVNGRVSLAAVDAPIENRLTDRVYLLSDSGLLRCVRRVDAVWPTLHVELPTEDEQPTTTALGAPDERPGSSVEESPAANEGQPDGRAAGEDPFGMGDGDDDPLAPAGGEEDPFAAGSDDEDPFGDSGAEDEDPFGP
jgi:outer membrane protein assembly factor BamB